MPALSETAAFVPHLLVAGSLVVVLLLVFRGLHVPRVPRLGEVLCAGGLTMLYIVGFGDMIFGVIATPEVRANVREFADAVGPPAGFAMVSAGIAILAGAAQRTARLQRERAAMNTLASRARDSDQLLMGVMQTSPGGMFVLRIIRDKAGEITEYRLELCNQVFEHLVGAHRSRLIGTGLAKLADRKLGAWLVAQANDAAATTLPVRDERKFPTADRASWFEVMMVAHADRIAGTLADISTRKNAEAESWRSARTDPLTQLANRKLMMERLQTELGATRRDESPDLLVMFFDFDGFKKVNDTLGHDAGDRLLVSIAHRLHETATAHRPSQKRSPLVCRLGGDEFVVIIPGVRSDEQARELTDVFLEALKAEHEITDGPIKSSASIGALLLATSQVTTSQEVLRAADEAMYRAKNSGKSRCEFGTLRRLTPEDDSDTPPANPIRDAA